jgi:hypothetical protein
MNYGDTIYIANFHVSRGTTALSYHPYSCVYPLGGGLKKVLGEQEKKLIPP